MASSSADQAGKQRDASVEGFSPSIAKWFSETFRAPSEAQRLAWPVIRRGDNCLLLAPTGSGKTLAAFMCAIDDLCRRSQEGELCDGIHILYISPLKALGNDIHKNLQGPLASIRRTGGEDLPEIRIAVRTGDTPQSERAKMIRRPPHILITTPESLYLLLGSKRIADALRSIRTVIVDEVHALCSNKRGTHLAVSLERLAQRVDKPFQRVGCSATLRPLEDIAGFLVGRDARGRRRPCSIVNAGMRKDLDVQVVAPLEDFLEASNTALWSSAYEKLLEGIAQHTTTLIFANSRYKAERTSLRMGELAGKDLRIGAHHGSMSKEIRLETEDALKSGHLDALVSTSSLELGIDIGSVDIVYQLESPKSISSGLQRVGRAGHLLDATSKGRILVFERDEILEGAVICRSMTTGTVDPISIPQGCLDVLAQQIAGAVASGDWQVDQLFALVRRSYPYRQLPREQFDAVLGMLAGEHPFEMAHAPRPLILWDRAAGKVSPARSCAHVSAMCVGTIPEDSNYDVVIAKSNKRVGTVHSEFVDDCLRIGDVFVLGSSSWRVVGVRKNRLLVQDAPGSTPTVPWWLGPMESRTPEVGTGVGVLRREVATRLNDPALAGWLQDEYHLGPHAAAALIDYVREQQLVAGIVPDEARLLIESWQDELGRLNVIVHSPYGSRINKTWGVIVAARAKAEHGQDWTASASNDVLLLTRKEEQAPPLHDLDARGLLESPLRESLQETAVALAKEAVSAGGSFRDAAVCALQILRAWRGKRVPPWLQNHRASELHEAAKEHTDYPVAAEVLREYLCDSLDVPGLTDLLGKIDQGEIELVFRDVESPSPFAHSVLVHDRYKGGDHQMGRDRRAHLLRLHRRVLEEVLTSEQMAQLLDTRAIERLELRLKHRSETSQVRNSDELAQAIRDLGDVPASVGALREIVEGDPLEMLTPLLKARRIVAVHLPAGEEEPFRLVTADLWRQYHDAFSISGKTSRLQLHVPRIRGGKIADFGVDSATKCIPAKWRKRMSLSEARAAIIERYLRCSGPITQYEVMNRTGWPIGEVERILEQLVTAGRIAKGVYASDKPSPQWVNKANLEEIHRLTMGYLKRELGACAPYEAVDFMTRWQHLHPATRLSGLDGLRDVLGQLQGLEVPQASLETEILPGRIADYKPEMLDQLIAAGEVCWRRVSTQGVRRGILTLCFRRDMHWLAEGSPLEFDVEQEADCDIAPSILQVRNFFREHGPAFFDDVLAATDLEGGPVLRAVWYLAWCGELTCDTFECLRHAGFEATLSACYDLMHRPEHILSGKDSAKRVVARMKRRKLDPRLGRWSPTERLVPATQPLPEVDIIRRWTRLLLRRWGIVSKDIIAREVAAPKWDRLLPELKRLELLGKINRGYFIESHYGEQYGLPEAIEMLRDARGRRGEGKELGYLPDEPMFHASLHDPANLYGTCLDMVTESNHRIPRSRKLTSGSARMVLQAGQPLLLAEGKLLATLSKQRLAKAIGQLRQDYAGRQLPTQFGQWNGYPIDAHPVAQFLLGLGFAWKAEQLVWPAPPNGERPAPGPIPRAFLPFHDDPVPPSLGPERFIRKVADAIRPAVQRLLQVLTKELSGEGWEIDWTRDPPTINYQGVCCMWLICGNLGIRATLRPPAVTGFDKALGQRRDWVWVEKPDDVNEAFVEDLRNRRQIAEECIGGYLRRKGEHTASQS